MAGGAGDAGRDHAAAALVPVPHRQDLVLVAHRDGAAAGADGAAAAAAQPARRHDRASCSSSRRRACATGSRRRPARRSAMPSPCSTGCCALAEPIFPADPRRRAIDAGGRLRHRAAQRRGWARRHLPGDGQRADDVRLPGLSARPSRSRDRRARRCASCSCSTATRSYCQPCLSPVWDTALAGHALMEVGDERLGAGDRAARSTGSTSGRCSTRSATGRRRGPGCGRAAGRSSTPTRTIPISTTPRRSAWRSTASTRARYRAAIDRAAEWVDRHAEPQRRLGLVRRRQHAFLSEPHPVRRSRRAARPADRRCLGALPRLSGAARACRRTIRRSPRRSPTCGASRKPTAAGSAAGAPTTSTAPGRCWPALNAAGVDPAAPEMRRAVAWLLAKPARRRRLGRGRRQLLAATRRAARRRTAPRRRPPGRCSA